MEQRIRAVRTDMIAATPCLTLDRHVQANKLKVITYHGHSLVKHFTGLLDCDVVMTTYGAAATEHRRSEREVLYHLKWFRVVLDEGSLPQRYRCDALLTSAAHHVRSRKTRKFEAVTFLDAQHYWCLTGTPIQNRIDDLGSLFDFCRVPLLQDQAWFEQHIAKPVKASTRRGCNVVKQAMAPLCFRRTKAILGFKPPTMVDKKIQFSTAEREQYEQIESDYRQSLDAHTSGRSNGSKPPTAMKLLLRLRISWNHGTFTSAKAYETTDLDAEETLTLLEEKEAAYCQICLTYVALVNQLRDPRSGILGSCSDVLCAACREDLNLCEDSTSQYKCPVCHQQVHLQLLHPGTANVSIKGWSSKVSALIADLLQTQAVEKGMRRKAQRLSYY
jgi:SWI/SNF-related matrix-associated actin-dependent regulator of chromatin subfamily A3